MIKIDDKHTNNIHRIYLLGFMGAGKSTVGELLANHLSWAFIDLDDLIETTVSKSISSIFKEDGEKSFRQAEAKCLRSIRKSNVVVATGGGAPCHHSNMSYMKKSGITVFIRVHPETVIHRLKEEHHQRPILTGIPAESWDSFILNKMSLRAPYYEQCDVIVDGNENPEFVSRLICTELNL